MSQPIRTGALVAAGTLAVLGLAACSPASQTSAASHGAAKPSAPALPTGHALRQLLLPASAMPAGLKLTPGDSRDTGDRDVTATASPFPAAKVCDALGATGWLRVTGQGSVSFAQNDYSDQPGDLVGQEIDAYPGGAARDVMDKLRTAFTGCATFHVTQDGNTYTEHLTWKKVPGAGDDAVEAVMTSPAFDGGATLVAVRVGHLVVTTLDNSLKDTGSAAADYAKALARRATTAG